MESAYLECDCSSAEHIVRLTLDDDEVAPCIYVEIQLSTDTVLKRLWRAVRYVLGYQCKYGHWDEVALSGVQVSKLHKMCHKHLNQWCRSDPASGKGR